LSSLEFCGLSCGHGRLKRLKMTPSRSRSPRRRNGPERQVGIHFGICRALSPPDTYCCCVQPRKPLPRKPPLRNLQRGAAPRASHHADSVAVAQTKTTKTMKKRADRQGASSEAGGAASGSLLCLLSGSDIALSITVFFVVVTYQPVVGVLSGSSVGARAASPGVNTPMSTVLVLGPAGA
jgi:hypothetical protein